MKFRLKMLYNSIKNIYPITDKNYKKLLDNWKINNKNIEDAYKINDINNYIRYYFIHNNLNLKFAVPTIAFINIQEPEKDEWSEDFNNKRRLQEINILKIINPTNYIPHIVKNKTHYIFNKKSGSDNIIKIIKNIYN
uniref:Uncharacterized protein n=1 Tax=viral metagenome TaxID=1070528 RepID=A0A6C0BAV9_9ZZZZ